MLDIRHRRLLMVSSSSLNSPHGLLPAHRAVFPLYFHAAWFTTEHHKEGFMAFLDTISNMDDVWLVTNWQAIQWMRDPQPISTANSFQPFGCDYPVRRLRERA